MKSQLDLLKITVSSPRMIPGSGNTVVFLPGFRRAVAAAEKKPVQHTVIDRPLQIELMPPLSSAARHSKSPPFCPGLLRSRSNESKCRRLTKSERSVVAEPA